MQESSELTIGKQLRLQFCSEVPNRVLRGRIKEWGSTKNEHGGAVPGARAELLVCWEHFWRVNTWKLESLQERLTKMNRAYAVWCLFKNPSFLIQLVNKPRRIKVTGVFIILKSCLHIWLRLEAADRQQTQLGRPGDGLLQAEQIS